MKKRLTAFIDESGTLPDPKDQFLVICAVLTDDEKEASEIINRVLVALRQTQNSLKLKELKFYHSRDAVKRIFLSTIISAGLKIFALIVDKQGRKITDSPENFASLVSELVGEIFLWHRGAKIDLVIDKHFSQSDKQMEFDKLLRAVLDYKISGWELQNIRHIDSRSDLTVNIADICAGAVLWKHSKGKDQFYNIIKYNIVVEKIAGWPDIKRKILDKTPKQNSPEPA